MLQVADRFAECLQGIQDFLPTFAQNGGHIHFSAAKTALLAVLDAFDRGETLSRHTALVVSGRSAVLERIS